MFPLFQFQLKILLQLLVSCSLIVFVVKEGWRCVYIHGLVMQTNILLDCILIQLLIYIVLISSVRSSYSHPDLLLIHHPTFSDHTGPQHWTFTF